MTASEFIPAAPGGSHRRKQHILWLVLIPILGLILVFSYLYFRNAINEQTGVQNRVLFQQGKELNLNLTRYSYIPLSLSLDPGIVQSLSGTEPPDYHALNALLRKIQAGTGALTLFIIDNTGKIIAASDAGSPTSLVGHNVRYRPYFRHVSEGETSHFFGVGTTADIPGYYLANGIYENGQRRGVIAVKVDLNALLLPSSAKQETLLLDENNVIISSTQPAWLYHSLAPLSSQQRREVQQDQKYSAENISLLALVREKVLGDTSMTMRIGPQQYLMVYQYLPALNMTLARLIPMNILYQTLLVRIGLIVLLLVTIVVTLFILAQRNLIIRLRLDNQQALKHAFARLEEVVHQRTSELISKSQRLEAEIRVRVESEKMLKNMRNELLRSEKLAVVGHLSAGIAHEINQPLAALSMLSANAIRFLKKSRYPEVKTNLGHIEKMVGFIGQLSSQLRSFSRSSDDVVSRLPVSTCIDNTMLLLNHRFTQLGCQLVRQPAAYDVWCLCHVGRLEQVLVNLMGNALEAMEESDGERRITARWYIRQAEACIEIEDTGPGIPDPIIDHIFEPFFTTKQQHGLGLGLAISADIISSFGGTLQAVNTGHGARFTLRLPCSPPPDNRECHD